MAVDQPFPLKKRTLTGGRIYRLLFAKVNSTPEAEGLDMPDGAGSDYFFSSRGVRLISSEGISVIPNFSKISSP